MDKECGMKRMAVIGSLVLMMPMGLMGHGRNSTVVRIGLDRGGAKVRIEAVITDLLGVNGMEESEWEGCVEEEKEEVLRSAATKVVDGFMVIPDRSGAIVPELLGVEKPEGTGLDGEWRDPGQQTITISLHYPFTRAPERLTFWQVFRNPGIWDTFHSQVIMRRAGELLMFPASLGAGLPLSRSIDWEQEPVPISTRSKLGYAACGWENRPANMVLKMEGARLACRLSIPVARLGGYLLDPEACDPDEVAVRICADLKLELDGALVPWALVKSGIRPMTGHSHHGISMSGEAAHPEAMLDLEMAATAGHAPETVGVECSLFGEQLPVLYSACHAGQGDWKLCVLTPESPRLEWNTEK